MARFPKIDSPCPLGIDEQRRINGHCQRCDKHVHALDGMGDAQRAALLAAASGPLCVSYRGGPRVASMAALAITLVMAGSTFAAETCADTVAQSLLPANQQQATASTQQPLLSPEGEELTDVDLIFVGGISNPQDAEWVDESALPELPIQPAESAPGSPVT